MYTGDGETAVLVLSAIDYNNRVAYLLPFIISIFDVHAVRCIQASRLENVSILRAKTTRECVKLGRGVPSKKTTTSQSEFN